MNPNQYINQKLRGLKRKQEIVSNLGGKCAICGYQNNLAALEFHHVDPSQKKHPLDLRHFSNMTLEALQQEIDKCILVCANCHREIHNVDLQMDNLDNVLNQTAKKKTFSNKDEYGRVCPVCGKRFKKSKGKIYCSKECRESVQYAGYPTIDEVEQMYDTLKSWTKVAKHFNITKHIVEGIRKRAGKF